MRVSGSQMLFAVKLFAASMLSYAIAVRIGLAQPYWAVATCCVCMNPLTGAIRSKAVYRMTGTVGAGAVSILLAAVFGSTPALSIIVAGIVACLGFGISFLDRTPRSYGFQLFSITLMIVAVAGVDHPESIFTTAVARVTEIALGIMATTMVDAAIAPRSLGNSLRSNFHRWLPSMEKWAADVFKGQGQDAKSEHDRLKLLADISSLSQLTAHLRYDPSIGKRELHSAFAIQQRLLRMVPILSTIAGRLSALGEAERTALEPALMLVQGHFTAGETLPAEVALRIREAPADEGEHHAWHVLIHEALADLSTELLALWSEIKQISAALDGTSALDQRLSRLVSGESPAPLPPDVGHALRMCAGIGASYVLLCGLWLATGWHQGANALLIGIVALVFFGGGDEPGRAIAMFGRFATLALALAAILCYWMLPLATDFVTFCIVMGAFILPLAAWAAVNPMATLLLAFAVSNINLQGAYAPVDFGSFIEGTLASLIGIYVAFLCAGLFRTWGSAHQVQRFLQFERKEIGELTRSATPALRARYMHRSLDRIVAMTGRLAATGQVERSTQLLMHLRIGLNAAELRILSHRLGPRLRSAVEPVLEKIGIDTGTPGPDPALRARIDEALDALWQTGKDDAKTSSSRALHALVELRIALFENDPSWVPA